MLNKQWKSNSSERITPLNMDGNMGQWLDWGKVQTLAIAPPINCLEDVYQRVPLKDPLDRSETEALSPLMRMELTIPDSNIELRLKVLQDDEDSIIDILGASTRKKGLSLIHI